MQISERPLTNRERELVFRLIEHGTYEDKVGLLSQVQALSVSRRCTCGCPTVSFSLNGHSVPTKGERVVSEHTAVVEGTHFGVMLFVNDGVISTLEVYEAAGTMETFGLPSPESIVTT